MFVICINISIIAWLELHISLLDLQSHVATPPVDYFEIVESIEEFGVFSQELLHEDGHASMFYDLKQPCAYLIEHVGVHNKMQPRTIT
jgi:hypothetical protein